MPGAVLSPLYVLNPIILPITLSGKYLCHTHFTDEDIEGKLLKVAQLEGLSLNLNPGSLAPELGLWITI